MNYSTPCSSRSVSPHPGAAASVFPKSPSLRLIGKRMETDNLSTAASRFGLRSATELVGDKEPRPAPKPSPVATLASASGASGSRDRGSRSSLVRTYSYLTGKYLKLREHKVTFINNENPTPFLFKFNPNVFVRFSKRTFGSSHPNCN